MKPDSTRNIICKEHFDKSVHGYKVCVHFNIFIYKIDLLHKPLLFGMYVCIYPPFSYELFYWHNVISSWQPRA